MGALKLTCPVHKFKMWKMRLECLDFSIPISDCVCVYVRGQISTNRYDVVDKYREFCIVNVLEM